METRRFRRVALGYDRDEVDGALAADEARVRDLEANAKRLGAKLDERDRRLKQALTELDAARESVAGDAKGFGRLIDQLYAEGVRRAAQAGDRAIDTSVRLTARLLELGSTPMPTPTRPPKTVSPRVPLGDGMFEGEVEVEIGPLRDFAQLSGFEDAANAIGATGEIEVKRFTGGRATFAMGLDRPVELLRELEERAPLEFRVRSLKGDRVVLDVDDGEELATT
jgi:hypothetical protein